MRKLSSKHATIKKDTVMMSDKKIHIDTSLVHRLIAEQFPQWKDLTITAVEPGGWDNKTFRLGDSMLIRLPSAECYADKVTKEQEWLPKLAPHLSLPIPKPLSMGHPTDEYPWNWSIYQWIEGETVSPEHINDLCEFATSLALFLTDLHKIDTTNGIPAGAQNFHRGGLLKVYDEQTRTTISAIHDKKYADGLTAVWNAALASIWNKPPVWVHGDVAVGNLLVDKGKLCAVIDFGGMGIGDPACDLVMAWTFFDTESRDAFKQSLQLDNDTWARARGWTLWKALCAPAPGTEAKSAHIISEVIADHKIS